MLSYLNGTEEIGLDKEVSEVLRNTGDSGVLKDSETEDSGIEDTNDFSSLFRVRKLFTGIFQLL